MDNQIQVMIDNEKCNGCGLCVLDCRRQVLEVQNKKAAIIKNGCFICGHCVAICPQNAVKMTGLNDEIVEFSNGPAFLDEDRLWRHLKLRRSVRSFKNIPVEKEKIDKIIDAGRITPTTSNMQNVRYIIIQNEIGAVEDAVLEQYTNPNHENYYKYPYKINDMTKIKRGFLFFNAPLVILNISPNEINADLAAMSMELMAEALGLGVCYIGLFSKPANTNIKLREKLGLEKEEKISTCLVVGYTDLKYQRSAPRKEVKVKWI